MYPSRISTTDKVPSLIWRMLDALAAWKIRDDVSFIAEHGDLRDFKAYADDLVQRRFGGYKFSDQHDAENESILHHDAGEELAAHLLPIDRGIIRQVFQWCRNRRRLRFVTGLIREEAARTRAAMQNANREGAAA